ncbi:hypothetical protein R1flu_028499 [Riccia fluitans]|uniref:Uncharacterized protein n=1 Tax=Riccia fluitans TaxID=41844 RepID=A0ABD1XPU4_9MARC
MKQEGRIPGSYVKISRHPPNGTKAPIKQSSHPRIAGRSTQNRAHCQTGHPAQKGAGKTRGEHRSSSKDLDVMENYKLEEWRICYATPSTPDSAQGTALDCDFEYYSDYGEPACETDISSSQTEEARENAQRQTDMLLPIESFMRSGRRVRRLPPVREMPAEEGRGDESGAESDSSWSGVEISDVEHGSKADLDDWYVVG